MLRRKIILIAIFLVLGGGACFSQGQLIERALISKDYVKAISLAERYLSKNIRGKDKILFLLGEAHIGNTNLVRAREVFRSLYKEFPGSSLVSRATLRIGDSFYLESNYTQAKKIYNYFLEKYSDHTEFLPRVYLSLTYCEEKLGNWGKKKFYMNKIKEKFPQSIEATKLKELRARGFHFLIQVGAFTDKKNALSLIRALKKDGFGPYLQEDKQGNRLFYKVRVGKFKAHHKAEAQLERLLAKGYPARIFP